MGGGRLFEWFSNFCEQELKRVKKFCSPQGVGGGGGQVYLMILMMLRMNS